MKTIKLILVFLFLFILVGCVSPKSQEYTVTIVDKQNIHKYLDFDLEYIVKEDELFTLPTIPLGIINIPLEKTKNEDQLILTRNELNITAYRWEKADGTLLDDNNAGISISEDTSFTLITSLKNDTKTIKITLNGGEIADLLEVKDHILTLPTPIKENYKFQGWYTNPNFISQKQTEVDFTKYTKQINLYAKFSVSPEYVSRLIDELPSTLSINDIEQIEKIKEAYGSVAREDEELVTNYQKLENAISQLPNLKSAKEINDKLEFIYNNEDVIQLRLELEEINEIIENTNPEILELVINYNPQKLEELNKQVEEILGEYIAQAKEFDKEIIRIPIYMEQYYSEEIEDLFEEYQTLNDIQKSLLSASHKLERLYENLQEIEESSQTIYYLNPETTRNVYNSKAHLCEAFFTDFYYYIVVYHGTKYLERNGIYDVYDFVELSQNFTGAGANNLYGIGNIAGRYMLNKDINGILENQLDSAFFGFCYQNDLYQDVLPFFINFFAYWRIDERYANTSNYGADIFAESWAPTVDIAKFFYYDENTSYVKTERMIDCLTNTASVVYGMDGDLSSIRLRGYKFAGWYDNPDFLGEPVTNLTSAKKLYAKWVIDQDQKDADAANLVDVYIYNLTTKQAVVNETTVGYVETMYNNLTTNAKQLVQNYDTLKEFIDNYR